MDSFEHKEIILHIYNNVFKCIVEFHTLKVIG